MVQNVPPQTTTREETTSPFLNPTACLDLCGGENHPSLSPRLHRPLQDRLEPPVTGPGRRQVSTRLIQSNARRVRGARRRTSVAVGRRVGSAGVEGGRRRRCARNGAMVGRVRKGLFYHDRGR